MGGSTCFGLRTKAACKKVERRFDANQNQNLEQGRTEMVDSDLQPLIFIHNCCSRMIVTHMPPIWSSMFERLGKHI